MKINILIKAAFRKDNEKVWANPAVIEVPNTGIRFVSGAPQSKEDADRINSAIHTTAVETNPRTGEPQKPEHAHTT